MKALQFILLFSVIIGLSSCEEIIDIDLNDSDPKYVIDANLYDLASHQRILISKTVGFNESKSYDVVSNAIVKVTDNKGRTYNFTYFNDNVYINQNFRWDADQYTLEVKIGNETFKSTTKLNPYVEVDSLGIVEETFFDEISYSMNLKFLDPVAINNYYKYDLSVNEDSFKFSSVFSDKFNDGLFVTHKISDRDEDLVVGDTITVRRYCVSREVYRYWNEYQSVNPGSAAPANPTSNISNGALGYFSVSKAKEYGLRIKEINN